MVGSSRIWSLAEVRLAVAVRADTRRGSDFMVGNSSMQWDGIKEMIKQLAVSLRHCTNDAWTVR